MQMFAGRAFAFATEGIAEIKAQVAPDQLENFVSGRQRHNFAVHRNCQIAFDKLHAVKDYVTIQIRFESYRKSLSMKTASGLSLEHNLPLGHFSRDIPSPPLPGEPAAIIRLMPKGRATSSALWHQTLPRTDVVEDLVFITLALCAVIAIAGAFLRIA
jgi:hypothetical protein